jgi:hypothetical protein
MEPKTYNFKECTLKAIPGDPEEETVILNQNLYWFQENGVQTDEDFSWTLSYPRAYNLVVEVPRAPLEEIIHLIQKVNQQEGQVVWLKDYGTWGSIEFSLHDHWLAGELDFKNHEEALQKLKDLTEREELLNCSAEP